MRYTCLTLLLSAAALLGAVMSRVEGDDGQGDAKRQQGSKADQKPLLLLDEDPPLLLDEPVDKPQKLSAADNSRCQVCHLNLAMEEMVLKHAEEGIGCAACHGKCDAHIADESWASGGNGTPPDIMFPRKRIDPACSECHETHDVPARRVVARWRERCPQIGDVSQAVCTDCHGHHRLKTELRKAWWDKKTGQPLRPNRSKAAEVSVDGIK